MGEPSRIRRRELVAVFDESGASNVPGEEATDDFALAAVVFAGRRAYSDLLALDARVQSLTGREDYKYRQVRQDTSARTSVVDALNRQSGLIRVFGYYAAGGAFVQQAHKELHAVRAFEGDVAAAEETLQDMLKDPQRRGLAIAIQTSMPAVSAWAGTRKERIRVHFDDRTDLGDIEKELTFVMRLWAAARHIGSAYQWMDWGGACPAHLMPVARVADIFAGDIRATFKAHGRAVWDLIKQDGFVRRHHEVRASPDSFWAGPIPAAKIGRVSNATWDRDWATGSTKTTMFNGYRGHLLTGKVSLYSPCGRGCLLTAVNDDGFDAFQVMD